MELSYENNVDDILALMRHQLKSNSDFKKRRILCLYLTPLTIFSAFAVYAIGERNLADITGGIIGALIIFFWYWLVYRSYDRKLIKHITQNGAQKEVLCRHTVTIAPEGFAEKTAESKNFQTWNAVTDVAFTPEYIFVYNTSVTAHIIPLRELGNTLFKQVGAEIRKYKMPNTPLEPIR